MKTVCNFNPQPTAIYGELPFCSVPIYLLIIKSVLCTFTIPQQRFCVINIYFLPTQRFWVCTLQKVCAIIYNTNKYSWRNKLTYYTVFWKLAAAFASVYVCVCVAYMYLILFNLTRRSNFFHRWTSSATASIDELYLTRERCVWVCVCVRMRVHLRPTMDKRDAKTRLVYALLFAIVFCGEQITADFGKYSFKEVLRWRLRVYPQSGVCRRVKIVVAKFSPSNTSTPIHFDII